MKTLFRLLIIAVLFAVAAGCSSYGVKKEMSDSAKLSSVNKAGVILRTPASTMLPREELKLSLQKWAGAYRESRPFVFLEDKNLTEAVYSYDAVFGKFSQFSENKSFLKFKTTGVINLFLRMNRNALMKVMADSGLDALVIYEVDGFYSPELQYIDMYSMFVAVDSELNIIYMDRQSETRDVQEIIPDSVKKILLSRVGGRFADTMDTAGFLEE